MKLILTIRVEPGGPVREHHTLLDLAGPATLRIRPVPGAYLISVLDRGGDLQEWHAAEIVGLRFEGLQ